MVDNSNLPPISSVRFLLISDLRFSDKLPTAEIIKTPKNIEVITILNSLKDTSFLKKNGFDSATALGMYIPNSYQVYWNTSAEKFRSKMLNEYNKFWTSARKEKAAAQNLTVNEVITLASIVQKETASVSERPKVAGLYLNRLRDKWPLQADPTIIFALKQKHGQKKEESIPACANVPLYPSTEGFGSKRSHFLFSSAKPRIRFRIRCPKSPK